MTEESNRRFGEAIARLRTKRAWSRAKLIAHLFEFIDDEKRDYGTVSETWLRRLENGEIVKLTRAAVEELSRALGCSSEEEAYLLLCADRNLLITEEDEYDIVSEMLNHLLFQVRHDAYQILSDLMETCRTQRLTADEKFELSATATELAIKQRRRRRSA